MSDIKIPWAKPSIAKEELNEVIDCFKTNWLSSGPKVKRFEKEVAELLDVPFGVAVSNGTIALDIVLKTVGIKAGDEVIVPAMTYFATASAVSYQSATPVFVDIERDSFNLDPARISEVVTEKTKAILFIDYGGNPSKCDDIAEVGVKYGIPVVQDAAQSLGAVYKGAPMGAQTTISTMSFHMAKVMTCIEGGMIFTHDYNYKEQVISRRNQGEPRNGKYRHVLLGTNARMTDLQAGIGLAQLRKLPELLEGRRRVAEKYDELFSINDLNVKTVKTLREDSRNAYFFYPILIDDRNRIADVLREKHGIDTRIAYPMPVYKQELYKSGKAQCRHLECPIAEQVTSRILNLPIFSDMSDEMIETVVDAIKEEI
ncbi:DegT/DnrJ/EryC1/StrS family aminotransferase [Acidobacteria bacterium AH-259-D05]|nr:DegT/DnrJ/EryC1/StrS family aminotransferase [Acidobacteria bacterium AH-259-D05]